MKSLECERDASLIETYGGCFILFQISHSEAKSIFT